MDGRRTNEWTDETEVQLRFTLASRSVSKVIGTKGSVVNQIQQDSGSVISFGERLPVSLGRLGSDMQMCRVKGTLPKIQLAVEGICNAVGDGTANPTECQLVMLLPTSKIPLLIGKKGVVIQGIQNDTNTILSVQKDMVFSDQCVVVKGENSCVANAVIRVARTMPIDCFPTRITQEVNPAYANPYSLMGMPPAAPGQMMGSHMMGGYWPAMPGFDAYDSQPAAKRARYSGAAASREWTDETVVQLRFTLASRSVSKVIGTKGSIVNQISQASGSVISFGERLPVSLGRLGSDMQMCTVKGTLPKIEIAICGICKAVSDGTANPNECQLVMLLPPDKIPLLIGKKGVVIQGIQNDTHTVLSVQKDMVFSDQCVVVKGDNNCVANAVVRVARTMPVDVFY